MEVDYYLVKLFLDWSEESGWLRWNLYSIKKGKAVLAAVKDGGSPDLITPSNLPDWADTSEEDVYRSTLTNQDHQVFVFPSECAEKILVLINL